MQYSSSIEIVIRKNNKGKKISIECPISIVDYNTFIDGVDR
jgi:hypothetical protein